MAPHIRLRLRVVSAAQGRLTLALDYPAIDDARDLTSHAASASSGRVQVRAGKRIWTVRGRGGRFVVKLRFRDARTVTVGAGLARDRYGNRSDNAVAAVVPR